MNKFTITSLVILLASAFLLPTIALCQQSSPSPAPMQRQIVQVAATSPVDHLCGSSDIISCSAYAVLPEVRDPARKYYSDRFHAACAYHDWCYRFGYATYSRSKEDCDSIFRDQMKSICGTTDWLTVLVPGVSSMLCLDAAGAFWMAVANSDKAKAAYKKGTTQCRYDGFCPPGKFETQGFLHSCPCPPGHSKHYTGLFNETAYCAGMVACPSGKFATTGPYRGCYCPKGLDKNYTWYQANGYAWCVGGPCPGDTFYTTGEWHDCACPKGSHKQYVDIVAKSRAICTRPCPQGSFATTGVYKDCDCPDGSHKVYIDKVTKSKATCSKPCPKGKFDTTGKYKGCECPPGLKKRHFGVFDQEARCEKPGW